MNSNGYTEIKYNTQNILLKTPILCNNCGKQGHLFHQCKQPITSFGIILSRFSEKGIEFLMIRRKDSFGYIDFIRGKYSPYNIEQLKNSIDEMSIDEKNRILVEPFDKLWTQMWGETCRHQFRSEENASSKKFDIIRNGVNINNKTYNLKSLVEESKTTWNETEWEFPKGRRNSQEKDLDCALREFEEETGYFQQDICIIENVMPFEEMYIGSNHKSYKHKYFLAVAKKDYIKDDNLQNYQKSEVSKLEWKTLDECMEYIRPYNLEKKRNILNIHTLLTEYNLI
jgi:8-oxo-dGTP pyrophosphatase MutT (NUDIX family)